MLFKIIYFFYFSLIEKLSTKIANGKNRKTGKHCLLNLIITFRS